MRTTRSTSLALAAAVAVAVAAPAVAGNGGPHPAPGAQSDDVTVECNDDGDLVNLDGPTLLWPPNHKLVDIEITMINADEGDASNQVTFSTMSTHDEIAEDGTEMNGSGNTAEDTVDIDTASGEGEASGTLQVRAERSGRGDGREYTVNVDGMAGDDECSAEFTILVPHDMRPSNRVKPDNG